MIILILIRFMYLMIMMIILKKKLKGNIKWRMENENVFSY